MLGVLSNIWNPDCSFLRVVRAHRVENCGDACVGALPSDTVSELPEDRERQELGADVGVVVCGRNVREDEHGVVHAVLQELQPDIRVSVASACFLRQDRDGCLIVNVDWNRRELVVRS